MSYALTQIEKGVDGIFVETEKFTSTLISFHFYMPLAAETAAQYSLLPFLMTTCSKNYPDFSKLNYKLSKLYGASLEASAEKIGDLQKLQISISTINDKYALDGEQLCSQGCELLLDLIFNPKLEGDAFAAEDVEREKRKAIEHIRGEIADKRLYARSRMLEEMYKNDAFGTPKCGTEVQVAALDGKVLYNAWRQLLSSAAVRVNVISDSLPPSLFKTIGEKFAEIGRSNITDCEHHSHTASVSEPKRITERMDITQGKLCIGFSSELAGNDNETAPLFVAADIFGGGTYSKLFANVREKMSLCYYCHAIATRIKGLVTVDSGVEAENSEKALSEILNQLTAVQNGDVSDFEFEASLRSLTDSLCGVNDMPASIDAWYSGRISSSAPLTPEEFSEKLRAVTKEQVIEAAKGIKPHTVYMLLPKEN